MAIDSTLAMINEGYNFIWNRCKRSRVESFTTRVMGRRAICIYGRSAAALYYDESKLERRGAIPSL
jgi:fatty-acid peroxygenase